MVEKLQVGKTPSDEGVVKTPDKRDLGGVGGQTPQEQFKNMVKELEVVLRILKKTEEKTTDILRELEKGKISLTTEEYRKPYVLMTDIAVYTQAIMNRFDRIIEIVRYGLR